MKLILKRSRILLAAVLAVTLHSAANAAAPVSPILTNSTAWDCILSGKGNEQGILFLTFEGDGYGTGIFYGAMTSARVKNPKAPDNDRSPVPSGRNPGDSPAPAITNIFGYVDVLGTWAYDYKGYVIGSFSHLVLTEGGTTNSVTNQISFKAKISSNRRFTASYSSTLGGNGTFKGVPMKTVTNVAGITGSWTGTETAGQTIYNEWFSLSNAPSILPNLYGFSGYGPAYTLEGFCLVSCQKKIAFGSFIENTVTTGSNTVTFFTPRGSIGSLSNKKTLFGGKTKGLDGSVSGLIRYDAFHVPQ